MKAWLLAFRPKTLTAAVVPILVGAAVVKADGELIKIKLLVFALLSALCIQIATNLLNDAIDFVKGTDRDDRLGPQRLTQSGVVHHRKVMWMGIGFLVAALIFGIPLVLEGGIPIVILGLFSLFLAYAYTGGPFPLAYVGLGDVFVVLFFGVFAVLGIEYVLTQITTGAGLIAGLQVGFLATVLIAINNLRDMASDKLTNKKTLAVRFGAKFVRREIALLLLLPHGFGLFWLATERMWALILPLVILPLALKLVMDVFKTEPSKEWNKFLAKAAAIHLVFGVLLSVGLWI